ncbi:MAG: hypothetical protein IJY28_04905, partial [Clostridia bacterium]|nr:hypothetical protein [Clostridia bacterium]
MLSVQRRSPVHYGLCNQTVTVYHRAEDGSIIRMVLCNAFFEHRKTVSTDKTGSREDNTFLLVIPGEAQPVFPGDKVLPGEGPDCADRAAWASLIPAKVPGLVVVREVSPQYWQGRVV